MVRPEEEEASAEVSSVVSCSFMLLLSFETTLFVDVAGVATNGGLGLVVLKY
jgi:hypothetical protein